MDSLIWNEINVAVKRACRHMCACMTSLFTDATSSLKNTVSIKCFHWEHSSVQTPELTA